MEGPFVMCRIARNERQLYFHVLSSMIFGWCNFRLPMNFLPLRAKLACTASAHFYGNIICSFSWSKIRNVFCAGKNWKYICKKKWHAVQWDLWSFWDLRNLNLFWISSWFNISAFIWIVYICWIYWTIEQGAILAQALRLVSEFALPPSPVCLLCSVLSTGTFAVVIACTLLSGLLGSLPGGMGGRQDGLHPCTWMRVNLLIHCGLYMKIYWSSTNFSLFWL